MKNGNSIFTASLLTATWLALLPVAQAKPPPSEDRGNGNSAAENVDALNLSTTGSNNTAHGWFSLFSNTTGSSNTADGFQALQSNTAGGFNTATGFQALKGNGTGNYNTANGAGALLSNDTGTRNSAFGSGALASNISGAGNTALGNGALFSNTADSNTAVGSGTLASNTSGSNNTAVGFGALLVSDADENTATGAQVLSSNTTGFQNTANGVFALSSNTSGSLNTANGYQALANNDTGVHNTANGDNTLLRNTTGDNNTANGSFALLQNVHGSFNTALGYSAGDDVTTANNVICIGADVHGANTDNSCFVGNIWSQSGGSQAVYVNSIGKLGAQVSSARFKDEIKPINQASEVIYRLKPVSFRYKPDIEPARPLSFGLIAEEVEKMSRDLVTCDKEGKPLSVRYDQVNAMLLNEFLKEHRKVEVLQKTLTRQQESFESKLTEQQKRIDALTSGLQKVGAQVEMSKIATGRIRRSGPRPRMASSNY